MAWLNSKDISLAMSEFFNLNMFILLQSLRELNENINVHWKYLMYKYMAVDLSHGPRQANLVLIAYASSESRGTFRQKTRSLAPLNGWACAVKICHDGMLEDTNSLDTAHMIDGIILRTPYTKSSDVKFISYNKKHWMSQKTITIPGCCLILHKKHGIKKIPACYSVYTVKYFHAFIILWWYGRHLIPRD